MQHYPDKDPCLISMMLYICTTYSRTPHPTPHHADMTVRQSRLNRLCFCFFFFLNLELLDSCILSQSMVCVHFSSPSCRLGSRSPPNASQPPAFFSKLTENTSAIVKSKKQEMIKKMTVVGNEGDFSKSDLSIFMVKHCFCGKKEKNHNERCDREQTTKRNFCFHFRCRSARNRNLQYARIYNCRYADHQLWDWFKVRGHTFCLSEQMFQ